MLTISSSAFTHNSSIPKRYTCDGEDINPPLTISGIPPYTKSMVLIMDDPDAPAGTWIHWLLWNISPEVSHIEEDAVPQGAESGTNDFERPEYGGPCPHSGTHHYFFKLYALDTELTLLHDALKSDIEAAMEGHILGKAELTGTYSR